MLLILLLSLPRDDASASGLYLFIQKTGTSIKRVADSALMPAYTYLASTDNEPTVFDAITETTPIRLEAGDEMYIASAVALTAGIVFSAEWTDF